ncbi:MAG: DUF4401 domain-containing protein [Bdellovibrionaceae bacterium]|nr:DUF4401 domain-containing protein [Pseudobdellovibrionaceae bacterium]
MSKKTIGFILAELEQSGDIQKNWREVISTETDHLNLTGPWHTSLLIGFGAWLSSLLFIGFLSALGMTVGGFGIYGIILLGTSFVLSRLKQGTFWDQTILVFSLSGQGFVLTLIAKDSHSTDIFKILGIFIVVFNLIWPFLLRTRTQAFISMIFFAMGLMQILYAFELKFLISIVSPLLFFAATFIISNESKLFKNSIAKILPSIASGLLFSGFGIISLSAYYIFESFAAKGSEIYPYPWLTSILVLVSIFFFFSRSKDILFKTQPAFTFGALLLIGATSLKAPGILFAIGVTVVGVVYMETLWIWLGLFFGALFTVLFLYGSDMSLITKSYVLMGLGVSLLVIRKVFNSKKMAIT